MSEIVITKDNFEQEVLKSDKPVLVDFWASWCGPCKTLSPVISEVAEEADGRYKVGKVNVDEESELSGKFGIMSIPTLIVFNNGEAVRQSVGFTPKEKVIELIQG